MSIASRVAQRKGKDNTKKNSPFSTIQTKKPRGFLASPKGAPKPVAKKPTEKEEPKTVKIPGVIPAKKKPSKYADLSEHESEGVPIEIQKWNGTTRKDSDPYQVEKQRLAIDLYARKIQTKSEDPKAIARTSSGNTAPPLPLEEFDEWKDDMAASSCLPGAVYDAFYRTGGIEMTIEAAKKLQEKYRSLDRQPRIRDEAELEELYSQFIVPKGGTLTLPEWDPQTFPPDGTMVLFGRRRSGKSWAIRFILSNYAHIYRQILVLTNTKQNDFWSEHVPFRFIHEYSQFVIEKIITHQRSIMAHNKLHADQPEKLVNPYMAVILDDVVSKNLQHDEFLKMLFYEGRHAKIAIFITTQHPKALPPGVRSNADVAVIFPQISEGDVDAIRTQYCNFFENKHDFVLFLNENTKDHGCVIIFMGDPQALPIQRLYHYTAGDPGPFLTCAQEYWDGDDKYYREYLEAQAAYLEVNPSDTASTSSSAVPPGFQWLYNDDQTDDLIRRAVF